MGAQLMDQGAELIAEQLRHTIDLLRAEIETLQREQAHQRALIEQRLANLESAADDHENRLRSVTDGVISFKVWSGLASGGSSLVSLAALLKVLGGG
jgi:multidrug resistance efflux pump